MIKDFENIPHTADLQIRVYGKSQKELFKNALVGMYQSVKPITKDKNCSYDRERLFCYNFSVKHDVEIKSSNLELLLIDFLSYSLYLSDVNDEAYLEAEIHELSQTSIKATLHGIKIVGFEVVEIKAVTYHNLKIQNINGIWQTDLVFDI